jgi:5-methylcytosine-specific restriction endonuclease McrA
MAEILENPALIDGVDNLKLSIELIPASSWFDNVRSIKTPEQWKKIKTEVYKKAGYRCQICQGKGEKWPVECHEIWSYEDKLGSKIDDGPGERLDGDEKSKQTLKGLIALCPNCHMVKHFGLAQIQGKGEQAAAHFCRINKLPRDFLDLYLEISFEQWSKRSRQNWEVDISYLENL